MHDNADLEKLARASIPEGSAQECKFVFRRLNEMDLNPPPGLIEGLSANEKVGMVYGPPGAGKTNLILDTLVKLAMGHPLPFAGVPQHRIKSVYFTEEGLRDIPLRIMAAANQNGWPEDENLGDYIRVCERLPTLHKKGSPDLEEVSLGLSQLRDQFGFVPEVLVVDTLANALGDAEENENSDMTPVMRELIAFVQQEKLIVLLSHHCSKNNVENIRGAGAIKANLDFAINIVPTRNGVKVRVGKMRDYDHFPILFFTIQPLGRSCAVSWSRSPEPDPDEDHEELDQLRIQVERILELIAPTKKGGVSAQKILDQLLQMGKKMSLPTLKGYLAKWTAHRESRILTTKDDKGKHVHIEYYIANDESTEEEV